MSSGFCRSVMNRRCSDWTLNTGQNLWGFKWTVRFLSLLRFPVQTGECHNHEIIAEVANTLLAKRANWWLAYEISAHTHTLSDDR